MWVQAVGVSRIWALQRMVSLAWALRTHIEVAKSTLTHPCFRQGVSPGPGTQRCVNSSGPSLVLAKEEARSIAIAMVKGSQEISILQSPCFEPKDRAAE